MNYHETLPTTPGDYYSLSVEGDGPWLRDDGVWFVGYKQISQEYAALHLPMFGPLPDEEEAALSLACEVAFARMVRRWCFYSGDNDFASYATAFDRFILDNERSLSLLREMERVTGELTK